MTFPWFLGRKAEAYSPLPWWARHFTLWIIDFFNDQSRLLEETFFHGTLVSTPFCGLEVIRTQ
jgi:hypothetical protein